ncbi:hypothetical protein [Catenulispora rubra]|uniref:hypothetical protein n=1 Tax=Catenulispora rubra TaxID=280293 RepID=UPI001E42CE97|nr:hypothetical protein [Catenulispora rubra]
MLSIFTARIFPAGPGRPVSGETLPEAVPEAEVDDVAGLVGDAAGFLWPLPHEAVRQRAAVQQASAATQVRVRART